MPQSPAQRQRVAEREAQVLQLKVAGNTFTEIGAQLTPPISKQFTERIYRRAMQRIGAEDRDAARHLEEARLDRLHAEAWTILHTPHYVVSAGQVVLHAHADGTVAELLDDGPRLAAIDRLLRISESRRKLLGLDAPAKVEHEWGLSEIDHELAKLKAELDHLPAPTAEELTEPSPPVD